MVRREVILRDAVTLVRWTGYGSIDSLRDCIRGILSSERGAVNIGKSGNTLILRGLNPIKTALMLSNTPGISWIAVGFDIRNKADRLSKCVQFLAKRYLRPKVTFSVNAESKGGKADESDIVSFINSKIFDTVRDVRIDEANPKVRFRVGVNGEMVSIGVEIRKGVGGVPVSHERKAYCLVSGGMHSSVVAWMAALSGFSLELVHVGVSYESVIQVAKLYSELSYRLDPSCIGLRIIFGEEGASVGDAINVFARNNRDKPIFTGLHFMCRERIDMPAIKNLLHPLILYGEDDFINSFKSLSIKGYFTKEKSIFAKRFRSVRIKEYKFVGKRADVHTILDELNLPPIT